jgi:hypothetical protein
MVNMKVAVDCFPKAFEKPTHKEREFFSSLDKEELEEFEMKKSKSAFAGNIRANQRLIIVLVLCSFCLFCSLLNALVINIPADQPTIQAGIDVSVNGDTILVQPGTYFENLNYNEKSITLASLYLTTGNEEYVNTTIIDGNQSGSCVQIRSCEVASLIGFTVKNGSGSELSPTINAIAGGGLLIRDSNVEVYKCNITRNIAEGGGGIFVQDSSLHLSSTNITFNRSYSSGGGINILNSSLTFDEENLCNIFLNFASRGNDIRKDHNSTPLYVYVDTFTVEQPDRYFLTCSDQYSQPIDDITIEIQNTKLYPVDADLYVSSTGDNNNSGLTPEEPLATINYALALIQPNEEEPNTINIMNGTYSPSLNDQFFPFSMRSYTNLIGESMEGVVLDAEDETPFIYDYTSDFNYAVKNITFIDGRGTTGMGAGFPYSGLIFSDPQFRDQWIELENIKLIDIWGTHRHLGLYYLSSNIKKLYVNGCSGNADVIEHLMPNWDESPTYPIEIENCYIRGGSTDGIVLGHGVENTVLSPVVLKNVEVTDVINLEQDFTQHNAVSVMGTRDVSIINCTFAENRSIHQGGGAIGSKPGGMQQISIYNSIVFNNYPYNIYINNDIESMPTDVDIYYSLVEGGEETIYDPYDHNIVTWHEGNLPFDTDPLFDSEGDYPFALSEFSPCIDAGTMDLPDGIELPEFDLAGNPRIYGSTVDMGAYEWQGVSTEEETIPNSSLLITNLTNYPNPFNPITTISFETTNLHDTARIEIYNIKGQLVETIPIHSSTHSPINSVIWNAEGFSSGLYFYKLSSGKDTVSKKMLLLK